MVKPKTPVLFSERVTRNLAPIVLVILLIITGLFYISYIWNSSSAASENKFLEIVASASSVMPRKYISALVSGSEYDPLDYSKIKERLVSFKNTSSEILSARILIKKGDRVYIAADADSETGIIPYPGDTESVLASFFAKIPLSEFVPSGRIRNIRVLGPIAGPSAAGGQAPAVLEVMFSPEAWHLSVITNALQAVLVVVCLLLIFYGAHIVSRKNNELGLERKRLMESQERLRESEQSKVILLDNLPAMAYRCLYDKDWTMTFISGGCYELTGYPPESLLYNRDISYNKIIKPEYRAFLADKWAAALSSRSQFKEEYEITTAAGETRWVWEQGHGIFDGNGEVVALNGMLLDITSRKNQELRLLYMTDHDILTGVHNRRYFTETVSPLLMSGSSRSQAIVLINMRKFGLLTSTFGYSFGEHLEKELAELLLPLCDNNHCLFHVSADRFVFYITDFAGIYEIKAFCEKLTETLTSALAAKTFGGNIGVVIITDQGENAEQVLKKASIAAQNVPENNIFGYCLFSSDMEDTILREAEIKSALTKTAYEDAGGLSLCYQPIIDVKTSRVFGFEALARFENDSLGSVAPSEFIPVAEKTQLIVPLGIHIMRAAFGFQKRLQERGFGGLRVTVNISAIQLLREDFLYSLSDIIKVTGSNPRRLGIEITESIFFGNYKKVNEKLKKIVEMGLSVALDDFGTGYSSLARERDLNVNCLKLDKEFISRLELPDMEKDITGDIISIGHRLGHVVIAEGVETERQRKRLMELGCDMLQGYLFSPPDCESAAVEFLETYNAYGADESETAVTDDLE